VLFSPPLVSSGDDAAPIPEGTGENPFTRYGDLSVVADIVARKMNGEDIAAELKAEGVSGYTVVANKLQRGPVIDVTGTGPNPAAAIGSAKAAVAKFDSVLTDLQVAEGADPNYLITSAPVEPPDMAVAQVGSTCARASPCSLSAAWARSGSPSPPRRSIAGETRPAPPHHALMSRPIRYRRRRTITRSRRVSRFVPPSGGCATLRTNSPTRPRARRSPRRSRPLIPEGTPRPTWPTARAGRPAGSRWSRLRSDPAGSQPGWTVWRPSTLAVAPDSNGHEKPATDRKS
jgi:hypothetical protein